MKVYVAFKRGWYREYEVGSLRKPRGRYAQSGSQGEAVGQNDAVLESDIGDVLLLVSASDLELEVAFDDNRSVRDAFTRLINFVRAGRSSLPSW